MHILIGIIVIAIIIAIIAEIFGVGFWTAAGIGILIIIGICVVIYLIDKFSKSEETTTKAIIVAVFGAIAAIIIGFFVVFVGCDSGDGEDASYYMDYNGNGQMDDGEHVYDTYDNGGGGVDYDGDGWNEYNYEP